MAQYDEFGSPIDVAWEDTLPGGSAYVPRGEDAWRPEDVTPEAAAGTGWVAPAPVEQIDYTGATYAGSYVPMGQDGVSESAVVNTFKYADGSAFDVNQRGEIVRYQPGYSTYEDPANIRAGYRDIPYAFSSLRGGDDGSGFTTFQGREVPVSAEEYVVDPVTGKVVFDERGQPIIQGTLNPNMRGENWASNTQAATLAAMAAMTGGAAYGLEGGAAAAGTDALGLLANPIIQSSLTGAGYGALTGGVTSALTGQDALKGALIGGATGGVLGGAGAYMFPNGLELVSNPIANAGLLGAGKGAAGGALNTLLGGGGDLKQNMLYGGIGGGVLGAGSEYFFPSASPSLSGAGKDAYARQAEMMAQDLQEGYQSAYKGVDTLSDEMLYGKNRYDATYDIARAKTQDYFDASADPNRYWTNTEVAADVKALDKYNLSKEQIRLALEQDGMLPQAAKIASDMSGSSAEEIARKLELTIGDKISPAGDVGIEMFKYTNTPLDEQYINQDLQEGYVSQYRAPTDNPSWLSGFGNLGSLLGAGTLAKLGGGGAAAGGKAAGGGSFVPKGMVDYSGILNLLAPKTSTRTSLLG